MLSLVLPTYNEAENIEPLVVEVSEVLAGIPFEIIVVDDDSPDGTWSIAESLRSKYPLTVLRRTRERGLATAVLSGFDAANGEVLAVMDADRQYEAALLRTLYERISAGEAVCIGSRYAKGGSIDGWYPSRRRISKAATRLAQLATGTSVCDPLSGYFAVSRTAYLSVRSFLKPKGFKILLEILAALPASLQVSEEPLRFHLRSSGESKLSLRVQLQFLGQVLRLFVNRAMRSLV